MNRKYGVKQHISNILFPVLWVFTRLMQIIWPIKFYSEEETRELLSDGYSISRFGDGEINIAMGKSGIDFQEQSEELQQRLIEILTIDMKEYPKFLIGIIPLMGTYKNYLFRQIKFWSIFNSTKRIWTYNRLNKKAKNQKYADPLFARMKGYKKYDLKDFWSKVDSLQNIWKDKNVLIVEGRETYLGINNDLLYSTKTIQRIIIPEKNAYSCYEKILKEVMKQKQIDIVLLIAGPMATVMAFDLYKEGYHAIDLGQVNSGYKQIIEKYGGYRNKTMSKDEYEEQIIKIIREEK